MLRVGITGGIGSGKSIVAKVFNSLGIPVYYADTAAKRLMQEDPELVAAIRENFGAAAYDNGRLNRAYLAEKVFGNPARLELLNQLVHPVTISDAATWMQQQQAPYALKEAALIFESGSQSELDFVIGVYAPKHLRIHRVMQRDGATREAVIKRMDNQIEESVKMRLCDAVITNDDQQLVVPQVLALHEQLLRLSSGK